jgi:cytochrome c oxidase assembly factor CtaG
MLFQLIFIGESLLLALSFFIAAFVWWEEITWNRDEEQTWLEVLVTLALIVWIKTHIYLFRYLPFELPKKVIKNLKEEFFQ